jgi:hypothetical protein
MASINVTELVAQMLAAARPAVAGHAKDATAYITARAQIIADGAVAIAADRLDGNIDDEGVRFALQQIAESEKTALLAAKVTAKLAAQDAINAALSVAGQAINKAIGIVLF